MVQTLHVNSRSLKKGFARDKDAFIQQKKTITGQSFPYITNVLYMKIIYIYKLSNFEKLGLQDMDFR